MFRFILGLIILIALVVAADYYFLNQPSDISAEPPAFQAKASRDNTNNAQNAIPAGAKMEDGTIGE